MATDTTLENLIINKMTYQQAVDNTTSLGDKELIFTTDKNIPIPTTNDEGKAIVVKDGDYSLEELVDLLDEQHIQGRKNFDGEVAFNGIVEHNDDINITDATLTVMDTNKDTVTKYKADGISTEKENGTPSAFIKFPKIGGTLALEDQLKDKLNILGLGETNRVYVRKTDDIDSSVPFTYSPEGGSIAYRSPSGQLQVEEPSQDKDAATKSYVDAKSQHYLYLTGESGILDDSQFNLVSNYDNLIIQRSGVDFRRCGFPSNGQGNYIFITPYYDKPNGTEEWADYIITIKQDKSWNVIIKNRQTYEHTDADNAEIMRNGNIMKQFATFEMNGNSEKTWSFPYSYDSDKKPMCWVNCVSEGNSANNGAAVIASDSNSMTVRLCGTNSKVTFYSEGFKTE